jgi:hypothetical protein
MIFYNCIRNCLTMAVTLNTLDTAATNIYAINHGYKPAINTALLACNLLMLGSLVYSGHEIHKAGSFQAYQQDGSTRGLAIKTCLFFSQTLFGIVGNGMTYLQKIDTDCSVIVPTIISMLLATAQAFFEISPFCGERQNSADYSRLNNSVSRPESTPQLASLGYQASAATAAPSSTLTSAVPN